MKLEVRTSNTKTDDKVTAEMTSTIPTGCFLSCHVLGIRLLGDRVRCSVSLIS